MKSTTAMKVILSQNNETAAKSIAEMAGSMTYMKASYGKKDYGDPVTKFLDMKKEIITGSNWERRNFIDTSFVMAMPQDKHIVLVQKFMNRPILADTPKFFKEPEILAKVLNLRTGEGPKPALPMPADMMKTAAVQGEETKKAQERANEINEALGNPEVAVVVTPENISDISRDGSQDGKVNRNPLGTEFAIALVHLPEDGSQILDLPHDADIKISSDPHDIQEMIVNRRVLVFSDDDAEALLSFLPDRSILPNELILEQKSTILYIDDEEDGDIFTIGLNGATNADAPRSAEMATPGFTLRWLCEIITVCQSFAAETERLSMGQ